MSVQLQMFGEQTSQELTSSLSEVLAKISHWLEKEKGWGEKEVLLSRKQLDSFTSADLVYLSGKMLKEHSPQTMAQTFGQLSNPLPTLGVIDLSGNCLIQVGFYPKTESGYTLSDILQKPEEIGEEFFLSEKTINRMMEYSDKSVKPLLADTQQIQAVVQLSPSLESGGKQPYQQNRVYSDKGIVPALCQGKSDLNIKDNYRIRRLTPIECERLQGFPDNHTSKGIYDGEVKEMSNTQRYKQCGNAVTVDVVQAIANKLHHLFEE